MNKSMHIWLLKVSPKRVFAVFEPSLLSTNPKGILMPMPFGYAHCQNIIMHGRELLPLIDFNYDQPAASVQTSHVAVCKTAQQNIAFRLIALPHKLAITHYHFANFELNPQWPWAAACVSGIKLQGHHIAIIDPDKLIENFKLVG